MVRATAVVPKTNQVMSVTKRIAHSTDRILSDAIRPNGLLTFARGNVEILSTMTWDTLSNRLAAVGSTVTRNVASRRSLVIGQMTKLSNAARKSDCTTSAGLGLPYLPRRETRTRSPLQIIANP